MNKVLHINRKLLAFGIPLLLLSLLVFLMRSSFLNENDTLELAITIDLLLTVPLLYFLLIRKTGIPETTVIPVMVAGMLIGSYFLPDEHQTYLDLFKTWALPVIEISILTFVVIKVRAAIKSYKRLKDGSPDFYEALKNTCYEILPGKLALPFATEVAVIYYGFINWKTRKPGKHEFTYHKKSGTPALLAGFIIIIGIEATALHFLLAMWNDIAAWILTGLSIYTAIQVWGITKSLSKRPVSVRHKSLVLRYGIMNEVEIPFSDIDAIDFSKKPLEKNKLTAKLSPLGELEKHNLVIRLKKESTLTGLYGIKKRFAVLGLHIDEPEVFKEQVEKAMGKK